MVKVDTGAPTASVSEPPGWLNAAHTLSIQTTDSASGVEHVFYGTGGADPGIETTNGVTLSTEGVHAVSFRAQDAVGHYGAIGHATVRIDLSAPVTTSNAVSLYTDHRHDHPVALRHALRRRIDRVPPRRRLVDAGHDGVDLVPAAPTHWSSARLTRSATWS